MASLISARSAGIVLCGGRSSRMGRPKALLPIGDETLLQRVVRIVGTVVAEVVVVKAPGQDLPALPTDVRVCADEQEYLGPLNGLLTGLQALSDGIEAAYLSSCDVPFLRPEFVARVLARLEGYAICMPKVQGFPHPLAAAYRTDVAGEVRALLAAGRMRPLFLTQRLPTRFLGPEDFRDIDPELQSLRNLNTPDDYAAALRDWSRH